MEAGVCSSSLPDVDLGFWGGFWRSALKGGDVNLVQM